MTESEADSSSPRAGSARPGSGGSGSNRPEPEALGPDRPGPGTGDGNSTGLETILEEIETVVEPVAESVSMAPAVGIAVAGGPMITLPEEELRADQGPGDSVRSGLTQAGPVAIAGMVVNGAAALVVVAVARLVSPQSYGEIAQLLGLFFILSMPGSAVLVGVVRRVTALQNAGRGHLIRQWVAKVHRICLLALAIEVVVVVALQGWIARQLSLPNSEGVVFILVAAGIWILLCVDRGLLQAHRSYRSLAGNLLVEGGVRTFLVVVLVVAHLGVAGYALGVFVSEVVATLHAHWLANKTWSDGSVSTVKLAGYDASADSSLVRKKLLADVSAAFVGLALLGLLQNVDVILLGRLDHANVGPYAAISVASKALVFGALALGAYLLPEATIRWNEGGHAIRQLGVTLIFLAVPAGLLLAISVFVPKWFLTLVFSAKLSSAAPAFSALVLAMVFLSFSVLVTNYLFGTGSRWIVYLLAGGSVLSVTLIALAHGHMVATARADLAAQGLLALAMGIAFVGIHTKHRGQHWVLVPRRRTTAAPAGTVGDPKGLAGTAGTAGAASATTAADTAGASRRSDRPDVSDRD
jgi:O-antigen/teichoic acid export membrane protein